MNSMKFFCSCFLVLLTLQCALAMDNPMSSRWDSPALPTPSLLPKLAQPLVLDGNLTEWSNALSVPMLSGNYVTYQRDSDYFYMSYLDGQAFISPEIRNTMWRGATDASCETSVAWTPEGLCLAVVIVDDQVVQEKAGSDDFELRTRTAEGVEMKYIIHPPVDDKPVRMVYPPASGQYAGCTAVGTRTANGFAFEAFIPWTALPKFTPTAGATLGLQFFYDDFDPGPLVARRLQLSNKGFKNLRLRYWQNEEKWESWTLVDAIQPGADTPLGPVGRLDVPEVIDGDINAVPIALGIGSRLASQVKTVRFRITDTTGTVALDTMVRSTARPAPWQASPVATIRWKPGKTASGYYLIEATALNASRQPLGSVCRATLYTGITLDTFYARLQADHIDKIAQQEPFRAAYYLSAGTSIERFKRAIFVQDAAWAVRAAREAQTKLDWLEQGILPQSGLYDLYRLTAHHDAQVVVDYAGGATANVLVFWGAVPLFQAAVREYPTATEALNALPTAETNLKATDTAECVIAGFPARNTANGMVKKQLLKVLIDPDTQVLLVAPATKTAAVLPLSDLSHARVTAVSILPDCPPSVQQTVRAWAEAKKLPMLNATAAPQGATVLIAGDPRGTSLWSKISAFQTEAASGNAEVVLAKENRLITVQAQTVEIARRLAELVALGNPITLPEIDALRVALVRAKAPAVQPQPLRTGDSIYIGEAHLHSFYSDGEISPTGQALLQMAMFGDFVVQTDHHSIDGARLTKQLLAQYGFTYPYTIGEEYTMTWAHFNAFPVKTSLHKELGDMPIDGDIRLLTRAAHRQGAIIQWNHPEIDSVWGKVYNKEGLIGSGLDAWEHVPARYSAWKSAGVLPALTGGSDNHDSYFTLPERTIIIAPSAEGEDHAEAIRHRQSGIVFARAGELFYGDDQLIAQAWSALADGKGLKDAKAACLRALLQHADVVGMLKASPAHTINLDAPRK